MELFTFAVPNQVKARETSTYTQGRVFDAITKKPLKAEVKLYDLDTDVLTQFVTSDPEYGDYTVVLNEGHHYAMYAAADKYLLKSLSFDYPTSTPSTRWRWTSTWSPCGRAGAWC